MFCRNGEDSIEHLVYCTSVQDLFPSCLKSGHPPRVPVERFFLREMDGKHRIVFALVIYGIYTIHNEFRPSIDHSDFKRCFLRAIADVPLKPEFGRAWRDIMCLPSGHAHIARATAKPKARARAVSNLCTMSGNRRPDFDATDVYNWWVA